MFFDSFFYVGLISLFIFFCTLVISTRNPIHSILSLIVVFFLSAVLLVLLEVEFLALSFIIVYVGAIAVLFLFIIMMLDIKIGDSTLNMLNHGLLSYFLGFVFILEITKPNLTSLDNLFVPVRFYWVDWLSEIHIITNVEAIGQLLYTYYFVFFLMAGLILLVAIIGALMLSLSYNKNL